MEFDKDELRDAIAHHKEMLEYHLRDYKRAGEVRSLNSQQNRLVDAGHHAAILNALLAIQKGDANV